MNEADNFRMKLYFKFSQTNFYCGFHRQLAKAGTDLVVSQLTFLFVSLLLCLLLHWQYLKEKGDVTYFRTPSRAEKHLKQNVMAVWGIMLMVPAPSISSDQTAAHSVLWMNKCVKLAFSVIDM